MYDQLFSHQWAFDRCVEGSYLFIPLCVFVCACMLLLFYFIFSRLRLSKIYMAIWMSVSALTLAPLVFAGGLFFGYAVLNCNDGAFWQGVEPANELYTKVKYECSRDNCPRSERDLAKLDPPLYRQLINNAKSKYAYDSKRKKYSWYVRPSYYYLVNFEGNGYGVFKIPQLIPVDHWQLPEYKGIKSDLPY